MDGHELAYVGLALRDRGPALSLLGEDLGLPRRDLDGGGIAIPAFGIGATALALFELGDPLIEGATQTGVHHIALAAADPAAALARSRLAPLPGVSATGLGGARQAAADPAGCAGVRLRFCEPLGLRGEAGGPVERIDHIGVASADNDAGETVFAKRLGCPVESRQTDLEVRMALETFTSDRYGAVYHQRPPEPVGGLRVLFVTVGDCELEFLQNFDPRHDNRVTHGQSGDTRQDQGAIGRFVARRGPGLHHIALKTPDIDLLLARLAAAGRRTIDRVGRPGSRRARIGFLHPAALGGVLLHFVERAEL